MRALANLGVRVMVPFECAEFVLRSATEACSTTTASNNWSACVAGCARTWTSWRVDHAAIAIVTFGPHNARTTFDRSASFESDEPMIVFPEESTVSLTRGFVWDWQLSVDVLSERLTHYAHD
jgi:hypothetical protein